MDKAHNKYNRVVLKLSGEAMAGDAKVGIDPVTVKAIAEEIKRDMDRATSDYMGMLGTVMNALALQDMLESLGVDTRVQTAIEMKEVAEPYIRRRAIRHLEKKRVVIFSAGIGNPYFSTDTTAALRAAEIGAEVILLAKKGVDGIYDSDPNINPDAKKFDTLTYQEILTRRLTIMDSTATSLCMDNNIPVIVFGIDIENSIYDAVSGKTIGTSVN